jgi:hypothetical protein
MLPSPRPVHHLPDEFGNPRPAVQHLAAILFRPRRGQDAAVDRFTEGLSLVGDASPMRGDGPPV